MVTPQALVGSSYISTLAPSASRPVSTPRRAGSSAPSIATRRPGRPLSQAANKASRSTNSSVARSAASRLSGAAASPFEVPWQIN
jgi:hypothetical protein